MLLASYMLSLSLPPLLPGCTQEYLVSALHAAAVRIGMHWEPCRTWPGLGEAATALTLVLQRMIVKAVKNGAFNRDVCVHGLLATCSAWNRCLRLPFWQPLYRLYARLTWDPSLYWRI